MTERHGSLMHWKADCGHWMVVYSLEPTPAQCPDCADKNRDALESVLKHWGRNFRVAVSAAEECMSDDVAEALRRDGVEAPDELVEKLQLIADKCARAVSDLDDARRDMDKLLGSLPPRTERLTMSEAS
ncbi:hypothetical protein [Mycolicibacterium sphagni]|uniref:Uncharacterized protein n=1 Tax=Mycolicibacterium sphagni TaxID=1786 RepID=A0A255DDX4_9MYCO|nr:hypothetical protein [Mycolicibacterium sphagni]OYN76831.1 hypothetical protein CG716_20165 [Mycolicibacterium sphagni]